MKKLLIGTGNPAKLIDYKRNLSQYGFDFVSPQELKIENPEETGSTFEDNAVAKARFYFQKTGIPTVSDDGGFEVDYLHGEPGVKSRRWTGKEMTDEEMINEVLSRMKGVPLDQRTCRLKGVIAVSSPFGIMTTNASIEGVVAEEPAAKRIKGFPFRSIMFLPNYQKYFCDVTDEELKILDHRKAALEKISDIFVELSKDS
ncbi:MAG: non-canonical purine NTP pyrophosphatase [Acidobacteriaceae bacterium]